MELDEKQKQIALDAFNKRWRVVESPATDCVYAAVEAVLAMQHEHVWVCGLDQQQCMEDCEPGNHDPSHLVCKKCGTFKAHLAQRTPEQPAPDVPFVNRFELCCHDILKSDCQQCQSQEPAPKQDGDDEVVSRMIQAGLSSHTKPFWRDIMTAALAEARRGMVTLDAVEKAIRDELLSLYGGGTSYSYAVAKQIRARLAPKQEQKP